MLGIPRGARHGALLVCAAAGPLVPHEAEAQVPDDRERPSIVDLVAEPAAGDDGDAVDFVAADARGGALDAVSGLPRKPTP